MGGLQFGKPDVSGHCHAPVIRSPPPFVGFYPLLLIQIIYEETQFAPLLSHMPWRDGGLQHCKRQVPLPVVDFVTGQRVATPRIRLTIGQISKKPVGSRTNRQRTSSLSIVNGIGVHFRAVDTKMPLVNQPSSQTRLQGGIAAIECCLRRSCYEVAPVRAG